MIPKTRELLEKKFIKDITNIIITFIGNECEKCKDVVEEDLTICLSFKYGTYSLQDIPNSKYTLKKMCKQCTYSRCSSVKMYVEIQDKNLVYPNY